MAQVYPDKYIYHDIHIYRVQRENAITVESLKVILGTNYTVLK